MCLMPKTLPGMWKILKYLVYLDSVSGYTVKIDIPDRVSVSICEMDDSQFPHVK